MEKPAEFARGEATDVQATGDGVRLASRDGKYASSGEYLSEVREAGFPGNWALNTAYAAANGLDARVERFYSMEQLEQEIAAGRPVIISVNFQPGELSASPIKSTDGHLIVVRGFNEKGDVIVNDPIASTAAGVRLVYNRDQLAKIWLRAGGIVYLVAPR